MTKRHKDKRTRTESALPRKLTPSAQTVMHSTLFDAESRATVDEATARLRPQLWERDGANVYKMVRAQTAQEILDLTPQATGLAQPAWHKRVSKFGPDIAPLIAQRLRGVQAVADENQRDTIVTPIVLERFIPALRWQGEAGAAALLECFDALDDYGRSLACVALGLLQVHSAADRLWEFYQATVGNLDKTYFVGALWGLIDLRDPRAADALAELLGQGRDFYELYPFLARAGDGRAIAPLLQLAVRTPQAESHQGQLMALLSIGHRLGREALIEELDRALRLSEVAEVIDETVEPETAARLKDASLKARQQIQSSVERLLALPPDMAEEYFSAFYRGLRPEDTREAGSQDDWLVREPGVI